MTISNDSIIAQLRQATTPEERSRLVDIFMMLARVGDRVRALREAREAAETGPTPRGGSALIVPLFGMHPTSQEPSQE